MVQDRIIENSDKVAIIFFKNLRLVFLEISLRLLEFYIIGWFRSLARYIGDGEVFP
jgi:hypothetical protein